MRSPTASSQPRDQTHLSYVSCIGRQVLYHYTSWMKEANWAAPGMEAGSPPWQADSLQSEPPGKY